MATVNAQTIPDYAQLGSRLFVVDGVNQNQVLDGLHAGTRLMGCRAQTDALSLALSAGAALTSNAAYVYGVRRVVVSGDLEIPSAVKTETVTTGLYICTCGTAGADGDELAEWQLISDAEFQIRIDGETYAVRGIDCSSTHSNGEVQSFADVALRIQAAAQAASSTTVQVEWDTDHFVFSGDQGRIEYLATISGTGTDISGSAYLNGQSGTAAETYDLQCGVTLADHEEPPDTDDWWTVKYQVLRSEANVATALYLAAELTQTEFDALAAGLHTDDVADDDLDFSVSVALAAVEDVRFPPVRCIRPLGGCLVAGGSFSYETGTVTGAADSDQLTVNAPGEVSLADYGAKVWVAGESAVYLVSAVDTDTGVLTLSDTLENAVDAEAWAKWHDYETVYVSPPMPGDIEGYTAGTELISNEGDGDRVAGLAAKNGIGFILRDNRVEILTRVSDTWSLRAHPATPPGCAGHATIADRWGDAVYYYAGDRGIMRMSQSAAQNIAEPIAATLRDRVDHSMDAFCHAVFDPQRQWYMLWVFENGWEPIGLRCPQLCLVFDTLRQQWYEFELPATSSGVMLETDGRPVTAIGCGSGLFTLDDVCADGAEVVTAVEAAGDTWIAVDGDLSEVVPGQPVHVESDSDTQRRLVASVDDDRVYIYGSWTTTPAVGDTVRLGAVRWSWLSPEISMPALREIHQLTSLAVLHDVETAATPVTLTVDALGKQSARFREEDRDWSEDEDLDEVRAASAGLRARRAQIAIAGARGPAKILRVQSDWDKATIGRGR